MIARLAHAWCRINGNLHKTFTCRSSSLGTPYVRQLRRAASRQRDAPRMVEESFRIHGGYGFSKEYEIEGLYREAPKLLIGKGTADVQRMIIGRRVLEEYRS